MPTLPNPDQNLQRYTVSAHGVRFVSAERTSTKKMKRKDLPDPELHLFTIWAPDAAAATAQIEEVLVIEDCIFEGLSAELAKPEQQVT